MKTLFSDQKIGIIFWLNLILVTLIAVGILPRETSFLMLVIFLCYALFAKTENSIALFVACIPFFIALPISAQFDNFNMWRPILLIIFLKWFWENKYYIFNWQKIKNAFKNNRLLQLSSLIFVISALSVLVAQEPITAIKKIIYFANLGMAFLIIYDLSFKKQGLSKILLNNFLIGAFCIAIIGIIQLLSTYALDFMTFHYLWAKQIQLALFGHNWSDIAYHANTWYSYSGGGLRLRMFSFFPDSHSFPIYLVLSLIAIFTLFFSEIKLSFEKFKQLIISNKIIFYKYLIIFLIIGYCIIASQTRGIWLAILAPLFFVIYIKRKKIQPLILSRALILSLSVFVVIFITIFSTSYIPQFNVRLEGENGSAFLKRMFSIADLGETSNLGRIIIWKETAKSIFKHPILGVGIGNYPVVLDQDIGLAKAGSSAHNLYLTVIAEIGIVGGIVFIWLLWEFLRQSWQIFKLNSDESKKAFGFFSVAFLLWVFAYVMTDAALFDERAFLAFVLICAIIASEYKKLPYGK